MITSATRIARYVGNSVATIFAIPFVFHSYDHITVVQTVAGVDTALTKDIDYIITGVSNTSGGSITISPAPDNSKTLTILRFVPTEQLTDYINNDSFNAEAHERQMDLLTMMIQQLGDPNLITGSFPLKFPLTEPASHTTVLPSASLRRGTIIYFDATTGELKTLDIASLIALIGGESGEEVTWIYRIDATAGLGKNTITALPESTEIRGTKKDAIVVVWDGGEKIYSSENPFMSWSDGYMTKGTTIEGDESPALEPQEINLYLNTVRQSYINPQIRVKRGGLNNNEFVVTGNGVRGVLNYRYGEDGVPIPYAEIVDGVWVVGNDILIPAPGDDENNVVLPDNITPAVGDITYFNGTTWDVLENPGLPDSGTKWMLQHDGTATSWVNYEEIVVDICVAGTPTEYTILGIPTPLP